MSTRYAHVLSFALEHPWAVTRSMGQQIAQIIARHVAGEDLEPGALAALVQRQNTPAAAAGGTAVIPVYGVIAPRMNLMSEMSGGTTFEALTAQLHEALANPGVGTIVFDVDSPGGNVAGATEFAREVLKARTQKPIIAQSNHLMASAAYWAMACATEVVASPSSMVGSVGIYTMHDDVSEALAKLGVKRTVIGAGKFKTEGLDGGPLSEAALAHVTQIVASAYDRFVTDVAAGRGVKRTEVENGYGEGRAITAEDALALGMIDRIGTLSDTIARATTARSHHVGHATGQEPRLAATSQERQADVFWQYAKECELLQLDTVEDRP
jgi:signal peptide peptidase SppA